MKNAVKIIVVFLLLAGILAYPVSYKNSAEIISITINDKERAVTGSGDSMKSMFLVYCEGEVFENTDSMLFWKYNSSDMQNKLKIGETYQVIVTGWRLPFFSSYRNIIEIQI